MKFNNNTFLPVAEPDLGRLEEEYLINAYRSGWISSIGKYVTQFEESFAVFCGVEHAVAVSSGTVALQLALVAANVGPGDEVIVPPLTFVATASTVRQVGATPVFVDCELEIGTMDPRVVGKAITPRTKAIIPVHLYGHPVDMDPIMELANKHGLIVIEDAAEAHGARYMGRRVGSIGHMATFSFYGNKVITTGEGGMITTHDEGLTSRMRFLKDHAMDPARRYWHQEVGFNFRMTNLQAAIGCAQLERFDEIFAKRRMVQDAYRRLFLDRPEIIINPARPWAEPTPWLVCAVLPARYKEAQRDTVAIALQSEGIDTRPYFNLLSDMPPYQNSRSYSVGGTDCSVARNLSSRGLNLPSSTSMTEESISRVYGVFAEVLDDLDRN